MSHRDGDARMDPKKGSQEEIWEEVAVVVAMLGSRFSEFFRDTYAGG